MGRIIPQGHLKVRYASKYLIAALAREIVCGAMLLFRALIRMARWPVTVSPSVAIVTVVALFILALVGILRARPEDIPKILRAFTRWFGK